MAGVAWKMGSVDAAGEMTGDTAGLVVQLNVVLIGKGAGFVGRSAPTYGKVHLICTCKGATPELPVISGV